MSNCASFLFRFASQIVSLGAFSSKIYSHITPLDVFSGKICSHVVSFGLFSGKFALTLSRPVCFRAEFVLACSAWSVSMQNFFSHCVAGHVLSQRNALLTEFSFARTTRIFVASRQKARKLVQVQQKIKIRRILWQKWQR